MGNTTLCGLCPWGGEGASERGGGVASQLPSPHLLSACQM